MKAPRLLLLAVAIAALHCGRNPNDGTGSSTESITAMLYNPGGSPAAQAKVCFYRHNDDPRNNHAVDSTYTDNNGNYRKNLDTGTYNILATLNTNATFQDSIIVTGGDTTRPPPDTLQSLGSISGRIELQGTDDPRTVFILFMGSNTFTRPTDLAGNFTATSMAKGRYAVTLLTTLDNYAVIDTSFVITAGLDSVIPQPIVMTYTGIPVPKGLRIEYDTMMQIVTLIWNKPTTGSPVQGYNIYRKHQDSALVLLRADWRDTVYHDSTGMQDITYQYRVAAIDTNTMEGTRSGAVGVTVVSAFQLVKTITLTGVDPFRIAIAKDSTIFIAYRSDNIIKVYNQNGDSINAFGQGIFSQPYGIALDSQTNVYIADPSGKIIKFSKNGIRLGKWTIKSPTDIAIDNSDNVFVVYSNATRLALLDTLLDTVGNIKDSVLLGSQTGNLALDEANNLYLVDVGTSSVKVYNSGLSVTSTITGIPSSMLMAADLNHLYFMKYRLIGQSDVDYIDITDKTGLLIAKFGHFNLLNDLRVVNKLIYLLNYNETPWRPQIQIFSSPF